MCDTAGVLYWSDMELHTIETAYLSETDETTTLLEEDVAYYQSLVLHDGDIYFVADPFKYEC